jgi:glycosyltransferase involved in cell wall biosynthesis
MKLALGMIARPIESILTLCLRPVISHFEGLVILTSPNPKWKDDVASLVHGDRQFHLGDNYEWRNNYSEARNTVIKHCEDLGYDWMMTLDADESVLPDDMVTLRKYIEKGLGDSITMPRYEFVDDFDHFCPAFYPDFHARLFKLNMGYKYVGEVHEGLALGGFVAHTTPNSLTLPMCHVYHYGKSKAPDEVWLKYNTYDRLAANLAPLQAMPEGTVMPATWALDRKKVKFLGNKPL